MTLNLPVHRRGVLRDGLAGAMGLYGLATHCNVAALPGALLRFPQDAGSHSDFATEWWYVTGYASVAGLQAALGFQVTFFRSRVTATQAMQSRLAARQLKKALASLTTGQVLKVVVTDAGSARQFHVLAKQAGHELLEHQVADGEYAYVFRRH